MERVVTTRTKGRVKQPNRVKGRPILQSTFMVGMDKMVNNRHNKDGGRTLTAKEKAKVKGKEKTAQGANNNLHRELQDVTVAEILITDSRTVKSLKNGSFAKTAENQGILPGFAWQ